MCSSHTLFLYLINAKVTILPYWQLRKACLPIRFWLWVFPTRFLVFVSICISDRKHSLLEHGEVAKAVIARLGDSFFSPITLLSHYSLLGSAQLHEIYCSVLPRSWIFAQILPTFSLLQWIQQSLSPLAMIFLKKFFLNLNFDLMKAYTLL